MLLRRLLLATAAAATVAARATPDALSAFLKRDIARWAAVVKEAGVKLE